MKINTLERIIHLAPAPDSDLRFSTFLKSLNSILSFIRSYQPINVYDSCISGLQITFPSKVVPKLLPLKSETLQLFIAIAFVDSISNCSASDCQRVSLTFTNKK